MGKNGFEESSTEALLVIQENLLDGLEMVGKRVLAGTFRLSEKEGSAPPSQSGSLTLALLFGVEDELESRILGFKRSVDPKLVTT